MAVQEFHGSLLGQCFVAAFAEVDRSHATLAQLADQPVNAAVVRHRGIDHLLGRCGDGPRKRGSVRVLLKQALDFPTNLGRNVSLRKNTGALSRGKIR